MRKAVFTAVFVCAIFLAPTTNAEEASKVSAFEVQFSEIWQLILSEYIKPIEDSPQARIKCLREMIGYGLRGCLHDRYAFYYSPAEAMALVADMSERADDAGIGSAHNQLIIPSVATQTIGEVEVVSISAFKFNTHNFFERAVISATRRGIRKFVMDLRNDPGGLGESVLNIACLFSDDPRDVMVTVLGRSPEDVRVDTAERCSEEKRGELRGLKFVILVNENSASASEIIAALAKDWGFAKVIGTRTFGKGSVQGMFKLSDGSFIQFTISKYYVGNNFVEVDGIGVAPDIVVQRLDEKGDDAQMAAALEELRK